LAHFAISSAALPVLFRFSALQLFWCWLVLPKHKNKKSPKISTKPDYGINTNFLSSSKLFNLKIFSAGIQSISSFPNRIKNSMQYMPNQAIPSNWH